MKNIIVLVLCGLISGSTHAKVKPIVHYNFGKAGNVTYAVAPEEVTPVKRNRKFIICRTSIVLR